MIALSNFAVMRLETGLANAAAAYGSLEKRPFVKASAASRSLRSCERTMGV